MHRYDMIYLNIIDISDLSSSIENQYQDCMILSTQFNFIQFVIDDGTSKQIYFRVIV